MLDAAPGNLPAIRALAEIYQRRGMMSEALVHYRRALQFAQHDTDLEHTVERMQQRVEPPPTPAAPPAPARVEELFDFDALLTQLEASRGEPLEAFVPLKRPPESTLDSFALEGAGQDAFAAIERQLREREEQRLLEERQARQAEAERKRLLVLQRLEDWLEAIAHDRQHRPHPSA